MYTSDFSHAPKPAQGAHLFFGGTEYTGVFALVRLAFVWHQVAARMKSSQGYMGHFIWYQFPFTFGNFSLWDTWQNMMAFARSQEHRSAISWLVAPGVAKGAFIRFFEVKAEGHSVGAWRAEVEPNEPWRHPRLPFSTAALGAGAEREPSGVKELP